MRQFPLHMLIPIAVATIAAGLSSCTPHDRVGDVVFLNSRGATPVDPAAVELQRRPVWVMKKRFRVVDQPERPVPQRAVKYRVLVEAPLARDAAEFATVVDAVLSSNDGWRAAGVELVAVDRDADVDIVLARPATVDHLCRPLRTGGVLSCSIYRRAVLNALRWKRGAASWGGDVDGYRSYLVNHEVGHLLGVRHQRCPEPGARAPVMMQQTKRVKPCVPNGVPTAYELGEVKPKWIRKVGGVGQDD